jgi:small subunit ribosomal protein S11
LGFSRKFRVQRSSKSTPLLLKQRQKKAALEALSTGMKNVEILVRTRFRTRTAIRAIEGAGFDIISIQDITSVPHNGCRPPNDVVFRISISN